MLSEVDQREQWQAEKRELVRATSAGGRPPRSTYPAEYLEGLGLFPDELDRLEALAEEAKAELERQAETGRRAAAVRALRSETEAVLREWARAEAAKLREKAEAEAAKRIAARKREEAKG